MPHIALSQQTFFQRTRRIWQYLLVEPYSWLFICFFQPARFRREYEQQGFSKRVLLMFRFALPLLLLSYPCALILQALLFHLFLSFKFLTISSITSYLLFTLQATILGIVGGILAAGGEDLGLGIILGIALGITGIVVGNTALGLSRGLVVAGIIGIIGGTARGMRWGISGGIAGSIVGGVSWAAASSLLLGIRAGVVGGFLVASIFLVGYLIGYYRLILYCVSALSAFRAYRASRKNPLQVFTYLHSSSLHWDECVFLPLPVLKQTLLIAMEQNLQSALKEITFIMNERITQRSAALAVSLEIALHDMQMRESIRDIAKAAQRLQEILPGEILALELQWVTPLARLADASREAARYCGPLNWQTRHNALEEMLAQLEKVYPHTAFLDARFSQLLERVVVNWRTAIRYEQEKLEQGHEETGHIDNPYNPGQVLKPHDTLFVGRHDVVRQLIEALDRKSHHPTFLLIGERRMGKSSTLRQLSNLLGAFYLPIFYDLQARGISSSIDVFLGRLAEEIYKVVTVHGIPMRKLERLQLREALFRNDAAAYLLFDEWLDELERMLERENRTILMLFDEFEKLEDAGTSGYLNLSLLLDWFRSTVQNRSRIALLFSGVRTFGEMGANWATYFVNAKRLKVSFLHPTEAHHLILHPVPDFPSQEIFPEDVVQEIIHVTGCHPFLIQAVCSELIDNLNTENREQAEIGDVALAATQVLNNWWDTYFRDLWERSHEDQRTCLMILTKMGEGDLHSVTQHSGLSEQRVDAALQALLQRDLVLLDKDTYRIAAPIFCMWVDRQA